MRGGHKGDSNPAQRVVDLLLASGWVEDGHTASQSFRSGSASSPVYGGMGGTVSHTGGRMRFKKPGTMMKATIGKLTSCFYEVEDGKINYASNVKTRDFPRVKVWAITEVCFHRTTAIRLGREAEWLEKNEHWFSKFEEPETSALSRPESK
ncbi:hypothetical protein ACRQ5Q_22600 [Bradyrhizobium sp. PMVTL-01]|uniref:hypothetical protein n=1 Tax=Bradyrhizobium sp. PMVTL-01 TaxID=3434999 RepID=UPI003F707FCE